MPAERPRVLLWDWDNTLADGWPAITAALNAVFDAYGRPRWMPEETKARVRRSLRDTFPEMFGASWEQARDMFYTTLSAQHLDHLRAMPGAGEMVAAGAAWPQGVVSNKTGAFLRREVDKLGWRDRFAAVVGAGDATADKPDAAPILMALRTIGAEPGKAVWYLGDTALDMQTARNAGCTAVLVGDAAHDGGVGRAAPDRHFSGADALASYLRFIAVEAG